MKLQLEGKKFGKLTVIRYAFSEKHSRYWECKCDCGQTTEVSTHHLTTGNTSSCGCLRIEKAKVNGHANKVHGMFGTPVGTSWRGMLNRCYNTKMACYPRYGGRGILACEFLRTSPINLKIAIGDRPEGMSLDRKNNDMGYYCGTCSECITNDWPVNIKWSTRAEQASNKRNTILITINGATKHLTDWSKSSGVSREIIKNRMKRGITGSGLISPKQ